MRTGPLVPLISTPSFADLRRVAFQEVNRAASVFLRRQFEPIRVEASTEEPTKKTNKIPQRIVNGYIENGIIELDIYFDKFDEDFMFKIYSVLLHCLNMSLKNLLLSYL
jgi:hypothetical protein